MIIAIPTDTVYGLAATFDEAAKLFEIKGRSPNHPLPILAASLEQIRPFLDHPPESFFRLAEAFWPGPLTLVVPVNEQVPTVITANTRTAGFRIPKKPLVLLVEKGPLAVTSANPSGQKPATTPEEVRAYFGSEFPVIDGGVCDNPPSTLLIWSEGWECRRKGPISEQLLRSVCQMRSSE